MHAQNNPVPVTGAQRRMLEQAALSIKGEALVHGRRRQVAINLALKGLGMTRFEGCLIFAINNAGCNVVDLSRYKITDGEAAGCVYYVSWDSELGEAGGGHIRRKHPNGRSYPVAWIGARQDWERFRDAIDLGFNEIDAVKELNG